MYIYNDIVSLKYEVSLMPRDFCLKQIQQKK